MNINTLDFCICLYIYLFIYFFLINLNPLYDLSSLLVEFLQFISEHVSQNKDA